MKMKLGDVIHSLTIESMAGDINIPVTGITHDSRNVSDGFVFVAVDGFKHKAVAFTDQAAASGAAAVIASCAPPDGAGDMAWITVKNPRAALSKAAANFYGNPTRKMKVVGITGTSGKTTVSYIIHSMLEAAGMASGIMGTIEVRAGSFSKKSKLTTPEATDIHAAASDMLASGIEAMVMEVSSHSLKLHRVDDVDFDVAVFMNLGHDHLDFHGDLEDYAASKSILFSKLLKTADHAGMVVNAMDGRTEAITGGYGGKALRFSMEDGPGIDIAPVRFEAGMEGIEAELKTPAGAMHVRSPLLGRHNLMNIMATAGVGLVGGIDIASIEKGIAALDRVPGRMDRIAGKEGRTVVVDYSHTPDSLKAAIESLSRLTKGRIITVFGAGGDREKEKRPLMGRIACEKSSCAVVTSDNPRSEDPLAIIDMIVEGLEQGGFARSEGELGPGTFVVIPDREEAINVAIRAAGPGDVVLIAGKGHEDYQIFSDRVIHFDDKEVALEALKSL